MSFYSFVKKILSVLLKLLYKVEIEGKENIPIDDRAVICSNHISMLDPILVAIAIPREISFMAKKELFKNKLLRPLLPRLNAFPVDREGVSLSAIKNSLKVLKEDKIIGMFPEGTRVKDENILNAKPGISMISIRGKAKIVPVYINSNYKFFKSVKIIIGTPIEFNSHYNKKLSTEEYKKLSQVVMERIYSLKNT